MYVLAIQRIQVMLSVSIYRLVYRRRFVDLFVYEHLPFAETHTKTIYIAVIINVVFVVDDGGEYPYSWQ